MSRPYRKIQTRYVRFRRPFARLFGYEILESGGRLRLPVGDGFIYTDDGKPLYY
jgi:hypothetical protein